MVSYNSYLFRLHWCESVSILGYTRAIERDTIIVNIVTVYLVPEDDRASGQ